MTTISNRKRWSKPELSTLSVEKTLGGVNPQILECEDVISEITGINLGNGFGSIECS